MKRFSRPLFSPAPLFALGALACAGSTPSLAQPPDPNAKNVAYYVPEVDEAWKKLRLEIGSQEFTAPRETIARYQQFYEKQGFQSAATAMKISDTIAQLYWQGLNDRTKALEIYEWATGQYGDLPRGERLKQQRDWLVAHDTYRSSTAGNPVTLPVGKISSALTAMVPLTVKIPQLPPTATAVTTQIVIPNIAPLNAVALGAIDAPPDATTPQPAVRSITVPPPFQATPTATTPTAPVTNAIPPLKSAPPLAPVSVVAPPASPKSAPILPVGVNLPTASAPPPMMAIPQLAFPVPPAALETIEIAPAKSLIANVAPPVFSERMVTLKAFLEQWRSGLITWEQLREQTQLSPDDIRLLTSATHVVSLSYTDVGLREKLGEIIAQMPELAEHYRELSVPGQFALAQFYTREKNPLAEVIFKELLESETHHEGDWNEEYLLEGLANYYKAMGDYEQAAQTHLRIVPITKGESWKGLSLIEAARLYIMAGKTEAANELYKETEKSSYGWAQGLALIDRGRVLRDQGKYKEARELFSSTVIGQYADQIKVVLLCELGITNYDAGDLESASKKFKEAIEQYRLLKNPLQGEGLERFVSRSQLYLEYIETWAKTPFISIPDKVRVIIESPQSLKEPLKTPPYIIKGLDLFTIRVLSTGQSLIETIMLRSYRTIPMTATADNAHVRVYLSDMGKPEDVRSYAVKEMKIEILPSAFEGRESLDVMVSVESPNFPDFRVNIPVHVEVQN